MHPQPVCKGRKHTVVTTGSPVSSGIPCTMVLTAYSALSPATNSSCHRHRRIDGFAGPGRARKTSADLTPATGARTTRLHRPRLHRSSTRPSIAHKPKPALRIHRTPDAAASTASHPNVRDDGQRPSLGTGQSRSITVSTKPSTGGLGLANPDGCGTLARRATSRAPGRKLKG
jgi:hypothetical protein